MKVTKACLILIASLTLAVCPSHAQTDSTTASTNAPAATPKPKAKGKTVQGKVASVDADAKTITLEGSTKRVITVTSKTKITKGGEPATFEDITVGTMVYARERMDADQNWVVSTLRIGPPKHRTPPAASTNAPASTPAPPQ
jgi:hypothetical protein